MSNGTTDPGAYSAPTDYAIVVGINGYNGEIPKLQGCVNDAQLFRSWLIKPDGGGLDPNNVTSIYAPEPSPDGKPRRDEIEDLILAFYAHQNQTGQARGRRLYLYFAGHGVTPNAPNDDDCGLVMANALLLSLRSLPGRLAARRVRRAALFSEIVLFMDCCRQVTGLVVADCGLPDVGDPQVAAKSRYLYGFAAQWAMTAAERLLPHPLDPAEADLWQGVFTHALLRGLTCAIDETGEITSVSLKEFVRSAVQELLPEDDNLRPQIEFSENLKPISFGRGVRVPVEVRSAAPLGDVQVFDGLGLKQLFISNVADAEGAFRFDLVPARYLVVARDALGHIVGKKPVQLFGEPVRVHF